MSNQVQIFIFQGSLQIRTIIIDNSPWFVATDVCRILDITNTARATSRLYDDEKGIHTVNTLGGTQSLSIINESGLYSLIFTSRKPEAQAFRRWVTSEVLPAIRRHGYYIDPIIHDDVILKPDFNAKISSRQFEQYTHAIFNIASDAKFARIASGNIQHAIRMDLGFSGPTRMMPEFFFHKALHLVGKHKECFKSFFQEHIGREKKFLQEVRLGCCVNANKQMRLEV